jgi:EAL domain-containing protein (putative c-di-GMP-specific phosphodiesterase class I)
VEAIISLAHKLDMTVVAEGIETPEQYAILIDMGCEFGQGYLFSRPIQTSEVARLLGTLTDISNTYPAPPYPLAACLAN